MPVRSQYFNDDLWTANRTSPTSEVLHQSDQDGDEVQSLADDSMSRDEPTDCDSETPICLKSGNTPDRVIEKSSSSDENTDASEVAEGQRERLCLKIKVLGP